MAVEFARNVLEIADANSTEIDPTTSHKVIDLMDEQKSITTMGGTTRLGSFDCSLRPNSKVSKIYGTQSITERHRHRFEFNNEYFDQFEKNGMQCVGINPESKLVEIIEMPEKRWYIGVQFHPEYSSTVLSPNPLIVDFVKAAISYGEEK
jgi:CTP synthase